MYLGMKKSDASTLKEILTSIHISDELILDLGNNNLNDENIKLILEGISHNSNMKALSVNTSSFKFVPTNRISSQANGIILTMLNQF